MDFLWGTSYFKTPYSISDCNSPPLFLLQIELQLQILPFLIGGISFIIKQINLITMNTTELLVARLEVYATPRQFSSNGSPKHGMIVLQENDTKLGVKIIALSLKQLNKLTTNAFIKLTNENGVNYEQWVILAQMVGNSRSYISIDHEDYAKDDEWIDGNGVVNHRTNDGVSIFPQNFIFDSALTAKLDADVVVARKETWKSTTFTRPPIVHNAEPEDLPMEEEPKKGKK